MPFIVHCPHRDCRKYMLLEDSTRGTTQDCLLCKRPIKIDTAAASAAPAKNARWSGKPPPSGKSHDQGETA